MTKEIPRMHQSKKRNNSIASKSLKRLIIYMMSKQAPQEFHLVLEVQMQEILSLTVKGMELPDGTHG